MKYFLGKFVAPYHSVNFILTIKYSSTFSSVAINVAVTFGINLTVTITFVTLTISSSVTNEGISIFIIIVVIIGNIGSRIIIVSVSTDTSVIDVGSY